MRYLLCLLLLTYGCLTNTISPDIRAVNNEINDAGRVSCIEYALDKQMELERQGIESCLATLYTQSSGRYDDEYHMVTVVHTDIGDVILDNRFDFAYYAGDVWYRWDKIQGDNNKWYKITGVVKTELRSKFITGKETTPPLM